MRFCGESFETMTKSVQPSNEAAELQTYFGSPEKCRSECWLAPEKTDSDLVWNAFYGRLCALMARFADIGCMTDMHSDLICHRCDLGIVNDVLILNTI